MVEEKQTTRANTEPSELLHGAAISPGIVVGPVHIKDYELDKISTRRVPNERVEEELNSFRQALDASKQELQGLRERFTKKLSENEARIFETHLAYLTDPIFIADVENLILNQQMTLEAAIAKVIGDFNKIFKLVESEYLRERAVDLRDVAIRVLRHLPNTKSTASEIPPMRFVLVAKELSIADLFNASTEKIEGIVTEEGGLTSHAAILARSLNLPAVSGISKITSLLKEGDFIFVDGNEGMVRLHPEEHLRVQYGFGDEKAAQRSVVDAHWIKEPARTRDGVDIHLYASCTNAADVELVSQYAMEGVGLYRSELLYMGGQWPAEDQLYMHYKKILELAQGEPVTFRLLDIDTSMRLHRPDEVREANPLLGIKSLRLLFQEPAVLRTEIRALLRASEYGKLRVLIPFALDVADIKRVKELFFEERWQLRKGGLTLEKNIPIGVTLEIPASALLIREIVRDADFLGIALDNIIQYFLCADRSNQQLRSLFDQMHPAVLRVLRKTYEVAEASDVEVMLLGETAYYPEHLPFLLGVGARRFSIAPAALAGMKESLQELDLKACRKLAAEAARCSSMAEVVLLQQRFLR